MTLVKYLFFTYFSLMTDFPTVSASMSYHFQAFSTIIGLYMANARTGFQVYDNNKLLAIRI